MARQVLFAISALKALRCLVHHSHKSFDREAFVINDIMCKGRSLSNVWTCVCEDGGEVRVHRTGLIVQVEMVNEAE